MTTREDNKSSLSKRRFLLFCGGLAALYPIIRFLGFTVPRKPRIIEVSRTLAPGEFYIGSDYILFDSGSRAWALSRRCSHLGCTVNYHEKDNLLECPCHQSRFSIEGLVLHGPAKKNLPVYQVEKRADDSGYIVTI